MTSVNAILRDQERRFDEPCCYVYALRHAPDEFDRFCIVHRHWLNGAPAESVVDRELRELGLK